MSRLRQAVGVVGLLGSVLVLALVLSPATAAIRPVELVASALPTAQPDLLVAGVGLVVGLAATVLSRVGSDDPVPPLVSIPPEPAQSSTATTGQEFDDAIARTDRDEEIQESLRTTAVATLVQQSGFDPDRARTAVREGTWTDDRLAAAFVGSGPFPLVSRLRAWLDPVAERRRRVERTLLAIERLHTERGERP